ncbi:MAG: HD domain-containing protein [Treponema sp.]|jgi:GTP pyrophosphokinase|nr:HD domain-containing protein [Treponema sp.]
MDITVFTEKLQGYGGADKERVCRALRRTGLDKCRDADRYPGLEAASILIDLKMDTDTIIASLFQASLDAAPDSPGPDITAAEILEHFGPEAALMTEGVTRIADISASNKTIQEAENIRKMLFAMVKDIRVIFIKLADRLHRMRALDDLSPEQRKTTAQECLDIYAPLADRLGISWIKDELEDLSLKYLNREVFLQIKDIVALKKGERHNFLDRAQTIIKREAEAAGIHIETTSRAKHFYSIYQKLRKQSGSAGDLYDLSGIRILCSSIDECYTLLGMVHRLWKPLESRFKDYIAMPKSNGYQSLHTTVMALTGPAGAKAAETAAGEGGNGRLLEIQIRTKEMHRIAEYGVASHWLYKKGSAKEIVRPQDISIVNRLKDWKLIENKGGENRPSESFLEDIKRELLKDSIYVFSPQGKVIELPMGATPIDFAYHIHTAVGEHCAGAKADGIIIPLGAELQNTQVVEILTSQNAHPHLNWLRLVKTSKARSKIRSWLQQNDDSLIIDKNVVAKRKPLPVPETPLPEKDTVKTPALQTVIQQTADTGVLHVRVEDEKNMMIRFAKCCHPVTGDPIIGYVSRGRGIIVHRKNCSNLTHIPDFEERKIDTEWENAGSQLIKHFKIEAKLSRDLFSEIEGAARKYQGHLIEGRLEETAPHRLTGFFTLQLERAENQKQVLKNIRGIPGIFSIRTLS